MVAVITVRDMVELIDRLRSSTVGIGLVAAHQLAGPVEHHHGLVQRIADDGQDRGDRGHVELVRRDHEEADRQHDVVQGADDGADRQLPLEAEPEIDQHREHRQHDADRARLDEFARDARPDRLDAAELVVVVEGARAPSASTARLAASPPGWSGKRTETLPWPPNSCTSTSRRSRSRWRSGARLRHRPCPIFACSSISVPPLKSMPKFRPIVRNSTTVATDMNAESGKREAPEAHEVEVRSRRARGGARGARTSVERPQNGRAFGPRAIGTRARSSCGSWSRP